MPLILPDVPKNDWNALDEALAAIQTWAGKQDAQHTITGYFSAVQPRCRFVFASTQTITTGVSSVLVWPTLGQEHDVVPDILGANYDNGERFGNRFLRFVPGYQLTPPIAGQYLVMANVYFQSNATGYRAVTLGQQVGTALTVLATVQAAAVNGSMTGIFVSSMMTVRDPQTAIDPLQVNVFQDSGGDLPVVAGTWVSVTKVS